MGEDMLRAAEEAIVRRNASTQYSEQPVYVSIFFSNTKDVLEFLNTRQINTNDIVSLIKHDIDTSVSNYELIFSDRIKTKRYLIVDEKWISKDPSLLKESNVIFNEGLRVVAEAEFKDYLHFPPKHNDGYRHVYALIQEIEWVSGNKITIPIDRSDYLIHDDKM